MRSQTKNKGYCLMTFKSKEHADLFIKNVEGMFLFGREIKIK